MPFDASKPYSEAPTKSGFNPAAGYSDSPTAPQEKPGFGKRETMASVFANPANRRNLGKDIGSFAYGLGTGLYGMLGDVTGGAAGPTTEETQKQITKQTGFKPGSEGFATAGELAPLVAGGVKLAETGIKSIPKLADALGTKFSSLPIVRDVMGTKSAAKTAKLSEALESGQIGKNVLSRANKAATRRKDVANRLYEIAEDRMGAKFKKGDMWQESKSGRAFFKEIGDRLSTANGTQVTSDTRKALIDLSHELLGTEAQGGRMAYSTPKVLTTVLRELRDAAAGDPKEGFKAIGQQEAGDLAAKLSKAIGEWEPSTMSADAQYAFHTKQLYPEGVVSGKFSKEKKSAEKALNLLETRLKQGTIKPEDVTGQLRSALKSPAIARLVSETDARQINAELDTIDKIKAHEDRVRAITKFSAKWIGGGALAGLGLDFLKGL